MKLAQDKILKPTVLTGNDFYRSARIMPSRPYPRMEHIEPLVEKVLQKERVYGDAEPEIKRAMKGAAIELMKEHIERYVDAGVDYPKLAKFRLDSARGILLLGTATIIGFGGALAVKLLAPAFPPDGYLLVFAGTVSAVFTAISTKNWIDVKRFFSDAASLIEVWPKYVIKAANKMMLNDEMTKVNLDKDFFKNLGIKLSDE